MWGSNFFIFRLQKKCSQFLFWGVQFFILGVQKNWGSNYIIFGVQKIGGPIILGVQKKLGGQYFGGCPIFLFLGSKKIGVQFFGGGTIFLFFGSKKIGDNFFILGVQKNRGSIFWGSALFLGSKKVGSNFMGSKKNAVQFDLFYFGGVQKYFGVHFLGGHIFILRSKKMEVQINIKNGPQKSNKLDPNFIWSPK